MCGLWARNDIIDINSARALGSSSGCSLDCEFAVSRTLAQPSLVCEFGHWESPRFEFRNCFIISSLRPFFSRWSAPVRKPAVGDGPISGVFHVPNQPRSEGGGARGARFALSPVPLPDRSPGPMSRCETPWRPSTDIITTTRRSRSGSGGSAGGSRGPSRRGTPFPHDRGTGRRR